MVRLDSRSNLGRAFASQSRHKKYEGVRREGDVSLTPPFPRQVSFTVGAGAGVSVGGKRGCGARLCRLYNTITGITGYLGVRFVFCPCKDETYK